jgi:hypothetical protein
MSHFIGLVFEKGADYEDMLAPYNEQDDNYCIFEDCTQEVQDRFDNLPEKDESLDPYGNPRKYPEDKEHYPTLEEYAENWFGYRKNEEGKYGYRHNPDAKWDWYAIGNRWDGYLYGKNGEEHNILPFNEVDWEKMFQGVEKTYTDWNGEEKTYLDDHIPFCLVDTDGTWHERGEMGWFGVSINDKDEDVWGEEVKSYVQHLAELPEEEREEIVVYAVDFHI